jgi:hypothetical protein
MSYTKKPLRIIRSFDEAIDTERSDLAAFYNTRDESALVFHEGELPTVFHARLLTHAEFREIWSKSTDNERFEAAFVRGISRVERLLHDDGQRRDWVRPDDKSGKQKPIPDAVLEQYFDVASVVDVGAVVYHRSFLHRSSGHYCPLPDISLRALTARMYHHVAQTTASPPSPSDADSSPPEAPQAATPAP